MKIKITSKPEGAELTSIEYNGKERLHDGIAVWKRHSPILFPIVGKLVENQTNIKGKVYEMSQHGFARDSMFETLEYTETLQSYVLKSNEETKKHYPYDFLLTVTHSTQQNTVTTQYDVVNLGEETMPFGIGAHPAFQMDYTKCYLEFEQEEHVIQYELEEGLIAREKQVTIKKKLPLEENTFDKDAMIWKGLSSSKLWVKEKQTDKVLLEFQFKGFPYLAIWSKREAPFLCIEPWYSVADKKGSKGNFEAKEGTIFLKPKEKFHCEYSVIFY